MMALSTLKACDKVARGKRKARNPWIRCIYNMRPGSGATSYSLFQCCRAPPGRGEILQRSRGCAPAGRLTPGYFIARLQRAQSHHIFSVSRWLISLPHFARMIATETKICADYEADQINS